MIVAVTFIAMPFLVITVEAGLRSADQRYEEAAATLGASAPHRAPQGHVADGVAVDRRRGGARLGPGARRVRGDDHVRRQPPGPHPDDAAGGFRGVREPTADSALALSLILVVVSLVVLVACATAGSAPVTLVADVGLQRGTLALDAALTVGDGEMVACSGRTGRARPRCCVPSPGSTRWTRAGSWSATR